MKILIVNTWYYPNMMGGAEHSVKILAENLAKNGNEVAVFTVDNKDDGLKKEIINGVTIYRSNSCKYKLYEAYAHSLSLIKKIRNKYLEVNNKSINYNFNEVISEFKPDIVHNNCIAGVSLSILDILKLNNIPVIQTMRDYWMLSPIGKFRKENNFVYKAFINLYRKYCINKTSSIVGITSPSEFTLNSFLKEGFFKNAILKSSIVNCVEANIDIVNKIVNEKSKNNNSEIRFLYVGWISEIKGIKKLVNVFKSIDNENISLTLCGDGELKDYLIKEIEGCSRIKYLGKLESHELMEVYKSSDVLIVPSLWEEPFGRVIIEGNMNGLPVIASDRGGIPEVLSIMNSGIIYQADSDKQLKESIIKMSDRNYIKRFYPNILKNIDKFFVDKQVENYEKAYQYIISKYSKD